MLLKSSSKFIFNHQIYFPVPIVWYAENVKIQNISSLNETVEQDQETEDKF